MSHFNDTRLFPMHPKLVKWYCAFTRNVINTAKTQNLNWNSHAYTCIHHRIQLAVDDMTMSGWRRTITLIPSTSPPPPALKPPLLLARLARHCCSCRMLLSLSVRSPEVVPVHDSPLLACLPHHLTRPVDSDHQSQPAGPYSCPAVASGRPLQALVHRPVGGSH